MSATVLSVKSVDVAQALDKSPKARKAAVVAVANAVRRDSNRYVPFAQGALRNSAKVEEAGNTMATVTYGGGGVRYARPQYYRTNYRHTTPGTTARWFDVAKAKYASKWQKEAVAAVREYMHG